MHILSPSPNSLLSTSYLLSTFLEQVWGLNRLLSFASVTVGYPKKGNIQRKVALAALHALKTFPRDPEILSVWIMNLRLCSVWILILDVLDFILL